MNDKQIQDVVKKMLSDQDQIQSVRKPTTPVENAEEYFFTYPGNKYLWSIMQDEDGDYHMYFYASKEDEQTYLRFGEDVFGPEGKEKLTTLFGVLQGKLHGFDQVLKDILGS